MNRASELLFLVVLSFCVNHIICPRSTFAAALSPADFGPNAETVDFDALGHGDPVILQLTRFGVSLKTDTGDAVVVVDAGDLNENQPHSMPFAVQAPSSSSRLEIVFNHPRDKVGLYFGHLTDETTAVMKAFDAVGQLLDETAVTAQAGTAMDISAFIGLGVPTPSISWVTLDFEGLAVPKTIDDLILEPRQDDLVSLGQYETILLSGSVKPSEKLDAISGVQREASSAASALLQQVAQTDPDLYVRERAVMALGQVFDPQAIPALVTIALAPPDDAVMMAAYNAVWALRQQFPLPDFPAYSAVATSSVQPGLEFTVQATVVSPVNRSHARIRFGSARWPEGKALGTVLDVPPYKGPLTAGVPVVLSGTFLFPDSGRFEITLKISISLNRVDSTTHKIPVYVDVQPGGGSLSLVPFPGWDQEVEHVLDISNEQ